MQPDRFPGTVKLPVNDLRHFSDSGAAEHFSDNRDNRFSRDPKTLFKAEVEPGHHFLMCVPRCGDGKSPGRFGIETFHRDTDKFASDINTAPEKGELRNVFTYCLAGMRKQLRGKGEVLGGGHLCSQSVGRRRG